MWDAEVVRVAWGRGDASSFIKTLRTRAHSAQGRTAAMRLTAAQPSNKYVIYLELELT